MIRKFTLIFLLATACQFSIADVIKVVGDVPIIIRGTVINYGYRKSAEPPFTEKYGYYLRFPKNTFIDCGESSGDWHYHGPYEPGEMSIPPENFFPDIAEEAEWEISIFCGFRGNGISTIKLHQPGLENGKKYKTSVEVADAWLTGLIAKAKAGDVNAQAELDDAYEFMYWHKQDKELQKFWIQKSAEHGIPAAQVEMGLNSNGDASVNWFTKAVEQGNAEAAYHLGIRYSLGGNEMPQDYTKAIFWLSKSIEMGGVPRGNFNPEHELEIVEQKLLLDNISRAKTGDAKAQAELANMYKSGKGVPQDDKQAFGWFKKAAEQGDVNAQINLANMYRLGEGVPRDYSSAVDWFTKAAEQGNVEAQDSLVDYYLSQLDAEELSPEWRQDYTNAKHWLTKAAGQGDSKSQVILGDFFMNEEHMYGSISDGSCLDVGFLDSFLERIPKIQRCFIAKIYGWWQRDYKMAFYWYSKAAEQDDSNAQRRLSDMYFHGYGVDKSEQMAYKWDETSEETEKKKSAREEAEKAVMISAGIKKWIVGKWHCRPDAADAHTTIYFNMISNGEYISESGDATGGKMVDGGRYSIDGSEISFAANSIWQDSNGYILDASKLRSKISIKEISEKSYSYTYVSASTKSDHGEWRDMNTHGLSAYKCQRISN